MLCVAYLLCMLIMCVYRCPFWIRRLESFRFRCSQKIACALACRSTLAPELVVTTAGFIHGAPAPQTVHAGFKHLPSISTAHSCFVQLLPAGRTGIHIPYSQPRLHASFAAPRGPLIHASLAVQHGDVPRGTDFRFSGGVARDPCRVPALRGERPSIPGIPVQDQESIARRDDHL